MKILTIIAIVFAALLILLGTIGGIASCILSGRINEQEEVKK